MEMEYDRNLLMMFNSAQFNVYKNWVILFENINKIFIRIRFIEDKDNYLKNRYFIQFYNLKKILKQIFLN